MSNTVQLFWLLIDKNRKLNKFKEIVEHKNKSYSAFRALDFLIGVRVRVRYNRFNAKPRFILYIDNKHPETSFFVLGRYQQHAELRKYILQVSSL